MKHIPFRRPGSRTCVTAGGIGLMLALAACNPTVKIQAPDKPIEINLNIKIDQQVRVKVDRELEDVLAQNPELF
ncbi:MAG: YnbE family lipoprotein [Parvibaculum sp.]|nr:YnbE family lipoprotein [Parvibaculum sp.]|tara:strand:- start:3685 stop:3906 length:222 start_codon:yes stop_codon:yes gene_type:complete